MAPAHPLSGLYAPTYRGPTHAVDLSSYRHTTRRFDSRRRSFACEALAAPTTRRHDQQTVRGQNRRFQASVEARIRMGQLLFIPLRPTDHFHHQPFPVRCWGVGGATLSFIRQRGGAHAVGPATPQRLLRCDVSSQSSCPSAYLVFIQASRPPDIISLT